MTNQIPCEFVYCMGMDADYYLHQPSTACSTAANACGAPQDHHVYQPVKVEGCMTIGQLIEQLQRELASGWVSAEDLVYIETPNGNGLENVAGVTPKYDAMPNEPRLTLVVAA